MSEGHPMPITNQVDLHLPFDGPPTFLRLKHIHDITTLDADVAVMGMPTDIGSPFMPGARFGPRSIREHSLRFSSKGYYDTNLKRHFLQYETQNGRITDVGDTDIIPPRPDLTFDGATAMAKRIFDHGALAVVLGGDHAISFPIVRGFTDDVYVIHFDAHIDYAPFIHGIEMSNSQAFRHIHALPNCKGITQVGIRGLRNVESWINDSISDGNRVIITEEYYDRGNDGVLANIPANANVYVSIDIDVLDMSLVPGTVSGEPNGLKYNELRDTLTAIAEHCNVVGFDLVEVNPQLDVGTGATSYLAAHTVLEFLGRICDQSRWKAKHHS